MYTSGYCGIINPRTCGYQLLTRKCILEQNKAQSEPVWIIHLSGSSQTLQSCSYQVSGQATRVSREWREPQTQKLVPNLPSSLCVCTWFLSLSLSVVIAMRMSGKWDLKGKWGLKGNNNLGRKDKNWWQGKSEGYRIKLF